MRGGWIGGGLLAGLILCSGGGEVLAGGAEEMAKGINQFNKGQFDFAIHYFTKALSEKDLSGLDRAEGLVFRGRAYLGNAALYKEDKNNKAFFKLNDLALDDLDLSIKSLQSLKSKGKKLSGLKNDALSRAYFYRGLVGNVSGDTDQAKMDLRKSIALRKNFKEPILELGRIQLRQEKYGAAIQSFTKVAGIDPEFPGIFKEIGLAYVGDGDFSSAVASFDVAVEKNPTDIHTRFERGGALAATRKYKKAIDDFDFVIGRDADHIDGLFKRGEAFLELKIFDKSKSDFDNLFAKEKGGVVQFSDRRKALLYYFRGQANRGNGDTENAIKDMREALKLDGQSPGIHKEMGYLLALKGDHVGAVRSFNQALAQNATYADALVGRAESYFFQKKYDAVIDDLSSAIWSGGLSEDHIQPLFFLRGRAFLERKQYKNAIRDLDASIRLKSPDPAAHFYRGVAYGATKAHGRAMEDLTLAGRANLDFPDFQWHYGKVLGGAGLYGRALKQFDLALEKNPRDIKVLTSRYRLYSRMGKPDLALADKKKVDELTKATPPPPEDESWWQNLLNKIKGLTGGLF